MGKRRTIEEWKQELVGKQFGRLTVIDVIPHYRNDKKDGYQAVCQCSCGNSKTIVVSSLLQGLTKSCGCLNKETMSKNADLVHQWFREHPEKAKEVYKKGVENLTNWRENHPEKFSDIVNNNVKKAQQWHRDNPEESKDISVYANRKSLEWRLSHLEEARKIQEKATQKSLEWRRDNPDLARELSQRSIQKAILANKENRNIYSSIEESEFYTFLLSLDVEVERQYLIGDHFYDFRINNFLIEYHGSVYHYTKFENLNNPNSLRPATTLHDSKFHWDLWNKARENNFHLIQVWDYNWFHQKDFIQSLIKDQISGKADYRDYIENGLLDNDYGFLIEGEQVEPKSLWISTWYRNIVTEDYPKAKVLVYNSGYTKIG